ncbi:helix-turn-helix domain-containing protein [Streptomyces sp. NPDC059802]|uniref:helix-turn-helix domain-containing protein n=1 Tax=Streptomyces sp. NPDC059802 TaxID=3346952 RepID=UPI0036699171
MSTPRERRRAEIALRAGISLGPYNRIEQGHAVTLVDTLIRIADPLGVPLADPVREEWTRRGRRAPPGKRGRQLPHPGAARSTLT